MNANHLVFFGSGFYQHRAPTVSFFGCVFIVQKSVCSLLHFIRTRHSFFIKLFVLFFNPFPWVPTYHDLLIVILSQVKIECHFQNMFIFDDVVWFHFQNCEIVRVIMLIFFVKEGLIVVKLNFESLANCLAFFQHRFVVKPNVVRKSVDNFCFGRLVWRVRAFLLNRYFLEIKVVQSCKYDVLVDDKASSSLNVFFIRLRIDKGWLN